jgi:hypothetical protein
MVRDIKSALAIVLATVVSILPAVADGPASTYCRGGQSHRAAAVAPAELAADVARTFNISDEMARNASVRCVGATLMACWVGANLNCGKADRRRSLPGASAYCRDNPGSDMIPMVATGHETIYNWRCEGPRAVAGAPVVKVDAGGYAADNWKEVR